MGKPGFVRVTDRYYRNAAVTYGDDRDKPFSIVLYGAKEDGSLDPETVFGRFDTTIGEAMGKIGLGSISGDPRFVNFPKPVKTTRPGVCGNGIRCFHDY